MAKRTTLALDEDVLAAAKALAVKEEKSLGQVISGLVRISLSDKPQFEMRNGFPLLPRRHPFPVITTEFVNSLRDEED